MSKGRGGKVSKRYRKMVQEDVTISQKDISHVPEHLYQVIRHYFINPKKCRNYCHFDNNHFFSVVKVKSLLSLNSKFVNLFVGRVENKTK